MRSKPAYSECRIFIDGLPALKVGDFIVTNGGSAYRVQDMRPSPSRPQRRYLKCLRWPPAELPEPTDDPESPSVYTLTWYKRKAKRRVTMQTYAERRA